MDRVRLHLGDSLEAMKEMEDNAFDLAIVDPPYGLGKRTTSGGGGKNTQSQKWDNHDWDNEIPTDEYFIELLRVSQKQVVWGGNYFPFLWDKSCRGLITWDKMVYIPTMSQIEYAWYSEDKLPQLIKINNNDSNRLHPTQKPVKLYEWLLDNYAKEGDKILDTHLGSGSIALACHNRGFELDGWEIDEEYYNNAVKRLKTHQQQLTMF
jgi:site-specific DNA-methyltransferase (adenine-specific)